MSLTQRIDEFLSIKKFNINEELETINQIVGVSSGSNWEIKDKIRNIAYNLPEYYKDKDYEKAVELACEKVLEYIEKYYENLMEIFKDELVAEYKRDEFEKLKHNKINF